MAETLGCFAIGQALWKWWTAVPILEASDIEDQLAPLPPLPILPRQGSDIEEQLAPLPLLPILPRQAFDMEEQLALPILPRQVSFSSEEEDWEVNSPDLRAHRQRSPSWTTSPKKALPPREPRWRRGSSRNGNDPKWQWADLTPGGEDECDGMLRGRNRRSRSLTRPEDFVHFVRVMPPPPPVLVLPVPVGFNPLQQKAFNDLSKASDLEDKVNKLDALNSLLQR
eukprot:symbB.v1.2.040474.t1/scaffold7266.1/size12251/2